MDKKSLEFPSLIAKNSLAVVAVGFPSWALRSIPRRGQFSTLLFLGLWSEPMGGIKCGEREWERVGRWDGLLSVKCLWMIEVMVVVLMTYWGKFTYGEYNFSSIESLSYSRE